MYSSDRIIDDKGNASELRKIDLCVQVSVAGVCWGETKGALPSTQEFEEARGCIVLTCGYSRASKSLTCIQNVEGSQMIFLRLHAAPHLGVWKDFRRMCVLMLGCLARVRRVTDS